ncbi:cation efflux transporter [Synechococcus sp. MVIR-18-1]|nr:cation efflux transporter [Synechococcus sp. MVIR-18-1]
MHRLRHDKLNGVRSTRLALENLLAGLSCWLLDLTVMQAGRTAFVVVYLPRINRWMALPSI